MNRLLPLLLLFLVTGKSYGLTTLPPLGEEWRLRLPVATSENLNALASNGLALVAVGNRGTIVGRGSGSWAVSTASVTADLLGITWSADQGQFIAVGSMGTILLSVDGDAWVNHSGLPTDRFNAVATISATEAVVVGASSTGAGIVLTTTDKGATWVRHTVTGATGLVDVTWTGSKVLAVAANKVFSSSDKGMTWTGVSLAATTPSSVKYVASASTAVITGTKSWRSVNGGPWTAMTVPSPELRLSVAGSELLGVNRKGEVWSSNDAGASWQQLLTAQNVPFAAAAKLGAAYTVVGEGGVIESSANGSTWGPLAGQVRSVAAYDGLVGGNQPLYVAVGDGMSWTGVKSPAVGASVGDIIWTPHSLPSFAANQVIWSGSQFVAVGAGIWTSSTGITWTLRAVVPGSASTAQTISVWGNRLYVFAYDPLLKETLISYSTDKGDTWSPFAAPSGVVAKLGQQVPMYAAVKANGDFFMAVGQGGRYMIGLDGGNISFNAFSQMAPAQIDVSQFVANSSAAPVVDLNTYPDTWIEGKLTLPYVGEDFTCALWDGGAGRFVVGTNHGGLWAFDGLTFSKARVWKRDDVGRWQKTADGQGTKAVRSIKWVDDELIAVGDGGTLWKSFNGADWREYGPYEAGGSGTPSNLMDALYVYGSSGSLMVAAGGFGTFVSSDGGNAPTPPTITFTPNQPSIGENGGKATITVEISERLFPGTLTVPVVISPASKRIKPSVSSLTFAEGELSKVFTLTGVDSAPVEADEILTIGSSTLMGGDLREVRDYFDASNPNAIRRGIIRLVDKLPLNAVSFEGTAIQVTEGLVPSAEIKVRLDHPTNVDVVVPLLFEGSMPLASYSRPPGNRVVIPRGQTSVTFIITIKNDTLASNQRTLWVVLGQPPLGASLPSDSSRAVFQVNVVDDDTLPSILAQPQDKLAMVGDNVTLTAQVSAGNVNSVQSSYTVQWLKNGVAIPGHPASAHNGTSTLVLNLTVVSLATAGEYSLSVTSLQGVAKSTAAKLAVVDVTPKVITAKEGDSLSLKVPVAGLGMSYQWLQNGYPISGQIYSALFLPAVAASHQDYSCKVSQGSTVITSGNISVDGVTGPPSVTLPIFGLSEVGADYSVVPVSSQVVDDWIITGLPLGLSYSRVTGAISGRPSKAGSYTVTFSAVNAAGKSQPVKGTIVVGALPVGFIGTFHANVEGDSSTIVYLGAHVSIVVSATGAFTGSYITESGTNSFVGNLGGPRGSLRIATVVVAGRVMEFELYRDSGTMMGSVSSSHQLQGWKQTPATNARTGYYTWGGTGTNTNAGFAFGELTVAASGAVTGKITMPNLGSHTFSSAVGPDGYIPVYAPIQTPDSTGSAEGNLLVTSQTPPLYAANTISGVIFEYTMGGSVRSFTADGGRYFVPTAGQVVMNLPTPAVANNLAVTFTGADLGSGSGSPSGNFTVKPVAVVTAPTSNPASTALGFDASAGEFSGRFFDLFGTDQTRVALFRGVLYRPAGSPAMIGRGSFVVPDTVGTLTGSVMLDTAP